MTDFEIRRRRAEDLRGCMERRGFVEPTITVFGDGDEPGVIQVGGHASVTGSAYEVGNPSRGGFVETIRPGAFKRTLSEGCDTVLNALHGSGLSGLPLARTKSGTLRLSEDDRGLKWSASLDLSDPDVQTLLPKLRRGDLDGASFAFLCTDDEWSGDFKQRTVKGVSLHRGDISIVPFGANELADTKLLPDTPRRTIVMPDYTSRARERLAKLRKAA